jgi:hypothetical protein
VPLRRLKSRRVGTFPNHKRARQIVELDRNVQRRAAMRYSTLPVALGIALALTVTSPRQAAAAVLTFDSLYTGSQGSTVVAGRIVEDEYQLTMLTSEHGYFAAFADGWQNNRGASNGTTTVAAWSVCCTTSFRLEAVDHSFFDFQSIDLGEIVHRGDPAQHANPNVVQFKAYFAGGGFEYHTVFMDFVSDGPGGAPDFQTFQFSPLWRELTAVDITGIAGATFDPLAQFGVFVNFDNITVNPTPIPTPGTAVMLALGLAGAVVRARRARQIRIAAPIAGQAIDG